MASTDTITIVVTTNNHFSILLGALLKSIEVNHKTPEKIALYIIDDGISPSNKKMIAACCSAEMFTTYWFKTQDVIPPNVKIPVDRSAFPITSYLRLFAPYIIPKETERYIYLDVDMIVLADISTLWHIDLEGKMFAGVPDRSQVVSSPWGGILNYKELGMDPQTRYFNAGLMMIDPIKWREADISNKVFKCIFENLAFTTFPDQYGLNIILADQWVVLDPNWNWYAVLDGGDPKIIHFIEIKPIYKSYAGMPRYQEDFYRYLRLTPWKNHQPLGDHVRIFSKIYNRLHKIVSGFLK